MKKKIAEVEANEMIQDEVIEAEEAGKVEEAENAEETEKPKRGRKKAAAAEDEPPKKREPLSKTIRIHFIDSVLGTSPKNEDIYRDYIASNAPDAKSKEEEIAALGKDAVAEKGMTGFFKLEDGTPLLWCYQIRGFFKAACSALGKISGTRSSKVKAYKKMIDGRVMVYPAGLKGAEMFAGRKIAIHTDDAIKECQRPLRASTMQGERVSIAVSEEVQASAWCEFVVYLLDPSDWPTVQEWLDYGKYNGLGQWRNSGKGAFVWEVVE